MTEESRAKKKNEPNTVLSLSSPPLSLSHERGAEAATPHLREMRWPRPRSMTVAMLLPVNFVLRAFGRSGGREKQRPVRRGEGGMGEGPLGPAQRTHFPTPTLTLTPTKERAVHRHTRRDCVGGRAATSCAVAQKYNNKILFRLKNLNPGSHCRQ
jgi:hypothetical protein